MKYFDIIKDSFQTQSSFDLGEGKGKETNLEKFVDGCTDSFIDGLMSGYAII